MTTITAKASAWSRSGLARDTWRQHRPAIIALLIAFAACATYMLASGLPTHAAHNSYLAHHCLTVRNHAVCARMLRQMGDSTWILSYLFWFVGIFIGAPLTAREFETDAYRFSATQGVSYRRQLTGKVAVLGAIVAVGSSVLGLLAMWCEAPFLRIGLSPLAGISRWDPRYFHLTALTLPAWTLLALSIGVLAGAIIKRAVPAMFATAVCLGIAAILGSGSILIGNGSILIGNASWPFAVQPPGGWLPEHLVQVAPAAMPGGPALISFSGSFHQVARNGRLIGPRGPVRRYLTWPRGWPGPHGSLQVTGWLTVGGRRLSDQGAQREINRIPTAVLYRSGDRPWLAAHRVSYWIGYQPGNRYWLFQCLFAAILLAFTGAVGSTAVWLAGRRK